MARLEWDKSGERLFELGLDRMVLYLQSSDGTYPKGVAWNGVTEAAEQPGGAEATDLYANNAKYGSLRSAETFAGSISAYTYPDDFAKCDGSAEPVKGVRIRQQDRSKFGYTYRTLIGNDTEGQAHGYVIHLVYGASASPSEKTRSTVNESPEASTMQWSIATDPTNVPGMKPTSVIEIDSTTVDKSKLKTFEDILYGSEGADARLPLPSEVITHFSVSLEL